MSQNHPVGQLIIFSQLILSPSTKEGIIEILIYRQGSWGSKQDPGPAQQHMMSQWLVNVSAYWADKPIRAIPHTPPLGLLSGTVSCEILGPTHAPSKLPRVSFLQELLTESQVLAAPPCCSVAAGTALSPFARGSLAFVTREPCGRAPCKAEGNIIFISCEHVV